MPIKTSRKVIPEQLNFAEGISVYIPLFFSEKNKKVQAVWELQLENGERYSGIVKRNRIQLPILPIGSHQLTLIIGQPILIKGTKLYYSTIHIHQYAAIKPPRF